MPSRQMANGHTTPSVSNLLIVDLVSSVETDSLDFRDTSYFASHQELPSPSEVLEKNNGREGIVKFENLRLVVKIGLGREVSLVQALSMQFVNKAFPGNEVPVPELFGWRVYEQRTFIYMGLIPGETLMVLWPSLANWEKIAIAEQLRDIVSSLKRLKQISQPPLIGSVCGGPVQDVYFRRDSDEGPFSSVHEFNDRLEFLITPWIPMSERDDSDVGRYYRGFLRDEAEVQFCHGDLNLSNIMVFGDTGDRRISGIIDWEQAGWYPEFWEYCKMHLGMLWSHDWRAAGWVEKVVQPFAEELTVLEEFWSFRCP